METRQGLRNNTNWCTVFLHKCTQRMFVFHFTNTGRTYNGIRLMLFLFVVIKKKWQIESLFFLLIKDAVGIGGNLASNDKVID